MENFTDTLWFFLSPWHQDDMGYKYNCNFADAAVEIWNYCILKEKKLKQNIIKNYQNLFEDPLDDLLKMFIKRKNVFFKDDNRIIKSYRTDCDEEYFGAIVEFE